MLRHVLASSVALLLACVEPEASISSPTRVPSVDAQRTAPDADRSARTIAGEPAPLDPGEHERFWSSPEDPPALELAGATTELAGQHYLTGNEHHLEVFAERLAASKGGGYVGVGADQAFLLLAWANPELAWLIDYDADVVAIHRVHLTFLRAAAGPEQFFELWSRAGKARAIELLRTDAHASLGDLHAREQLVELYLANLRIIHNRLDELRESPEVTAIPNYLTDAELYLRVRNLALADRIRPMVVDLRGGTGMRGIAETARKLDTPIRVVYLSNAEEYWDDYGEAYKANIEALPWRQDAVVLRTIGTWARNRDYSYNLQPLANYRAWLGRPWVKAVYQVVHRPDEPELAADEIDVFETRRDPSESPADRRWRKRGGVG